MQKLTGLNTGIGSLPFSDPDPALDLIFRCCPEIPFWPQLPRRGASESMVAQYSEALPCLRFTPEGVVFDPREQDAEMERFYDRLIAGDLEHFRISEGYAPGLWRFRERLGAGELERAKALKFHVTGPFTFAGSVNDASGTPLLGDEVFMQAFTKGLIMKAQWQAQVFGGFGKEMVLFIDEPYLSSFGSAFAPINREDVLAVLGEFCGALASDRLRVGVHCCGNTDWSLFTAIEGLSIINFDAFDFFDRVALYAGDLKGFFARGGILCWGIVPTQIDEKGEGLTRQLLLDKVEAGIKALVSKGVDPVQVREQLLVSPACGLGNRTPGEAQRAFALLREVSERLRG